MSQKSYKKWQTIFKKDINLWRKVTKSDKLVKKSHKKCETCEKTSQTSGKVIKSDKLV